MCLLRSMNVLTFRSIRRTPCIPAARRDKNVHVTERLYYTDSYLLEFRARVTGRAYDGRRSYLDRTAFYPTSGGQPFDTGTVGGVR